MLYNTFRHIPGIGLKTEKRLWKAGIHTWDDFKRPFPVRFSDAKLNVIKKYLEDSKAFIDTNPCYFARALKPSQHWRLFPHYRHSTLYLDIETTGLNEYENHITTIATYNGSKINSYVYGRNLDEFVTELEHYDVIVTYNGKTFDVPVIEKYFGITVDKVHLDLRHILRALGFVGGLKQCEKQLGVNRDELDGVDGFFAVLLWREFERSGDEAVLRTLLSYNIADAVNLEVLLVKAYNLCLADTPFEESHVLSEGSRPAATLMPDSDVIERVKKQSLM